MRSTHNSHVKRVVVGLAAAAVLGFLGSRLLIPDSFGVYGHYRADAIMEEAGREIRHGTNSSCLDCHKHEAGAHLAGKHRTISCEFCHGPYAEHVKDGKKSGTLPVTRGEDVRVLCLRCHNRAIQARPGEVIKTVILPDHLESMKVKTTHSCQQCHQVHAPLQYINRAKKMSGAREEG
ncbi:MAG: hypothetical protein GY859_26875 [Desulfobacterales bacterium]|nr:hypothetical protein [Desulfobacterales bacterium]